MTVTALRSALLVEGGREIRARTPYCKEAKDLFGGGARCLDDRQPQRKAVPHQLLCRSRRPWRQPFNTLGPHLLAHLRQLATQSGPASSLPVTGSGASSQTDRRSDEASELSAQTSDCRLLCPLGDQIAHFVGVALQVVEL